MIEPDGAGVPHGRSQQLAQRGEVIHRQCVRVERRQAPILPLRIELVGRRAHGDVGEHRVLLAPGVGAVAVDADGKVGVETDRHATAARRLHAGAELAVGNPLQKFLKFAGLGMGATKRVELHPRGAPPGLRPFCPRSRRILTAQYLKAGKAQQRLTLLRAIGFEIGAALRVAASVEKCIGE